MTINMPETFLRFVPEKQEYNPLLPIEPVLVYTRIVVSSHPISEFEFAVLLYQEVYKIKVNTKKGLNAFMKLLNKQVNCN